MSFVKLATGKVENDTRGWRAKVEIRQHVLDAIGAAHATVFDAFAGPGLMHTEVWSKAARYVGCDERWYADARCCYVADNRRVLRCIDLRPFTCFDFDAYGSPWEQLLILAARRPLTPGERIGLVFTEGSSLATRQNGLPHAMRQAAGLTKAADRGTGRIHDEMIARALHRVVARMQARVVRQWQALGASAAKMRYVGLVLEYADRRDLDGAGTLMGRGPLRGKAVAQKKGPAGAGPAN